jgi:hypothetical protein
MNGKGGQQEMPRNTAVPVQQYDVAMPGTVESVYAAVLEVARSKPFKKVEEQPYAKMVTFSVGMSALTWGSRWMVQVTDQSDGPHVKMDVSAINARDQHATAKMAQDAAKVLGRIANAAQNASV